MSFVTTHSRSTYYPARKAAGRPDLRWHDLRHTGAVLAAQTGATLAELMGRLGHSTPGAAMRYQHEHTKGCVEAAGARCVLLPGDLADPQHCRDVVDATVGELGGLQVLVNNVAYQAPVDDVLELSDEQWAHTFDVNIHSFWHVTKAAVPHLTDGGAVINTGSINGLRGNKQLIDYSATKGAVIALTYSLAQSLLDRGIRVNCVAPGPVWTPLIPATMPADKLESFGGQVPYGRPAQADEIAPSYVFFASEQLSSYYTGEVLAALGGETLPG